MHAISSYRGNRPTNKHTDRGSYNTLCRNLAHSVTEHAGKAVWRAQISTKAADSKNSYYCHYSAGMVTISGSRP